jgi:predicted neutral ceramidase superfamily lipid hydrolase
MPKSTAVHDDLHARAIVVDDGSTRAAIVSCDLIGVSRQLGRVVREIASTATGLPPAQIMVAATHTHMGPAILLPDPSDPPVADELAQRIADAIVRAASAMRPAVLKAGRPVDS